VFNRLHRAWLLLTAILEYTICGCTVCGWSKLGYTFERNGRHFGVIYDFMGYRIEFSSILDLALGARCGLEVCGFERNTPWTKELYDRLVEIGRFKELLDKTYTDIYGQRDRFLFNLSGIKLLATRPFGTERKIEEYGNKMHIIALIDTLVKNFLRKLDIDPMKLQLYVSFVKELIFGRAKKHTEFRKGWRYVSEDRYIQFLKEKYAKMGLDPKILDILTDRFLGYARYWWYTSRLY